MQFSLATFPLHFDTGSINTEINSWQGDNWSIYLEEIPKTEKIPILMHYTLLWSETLQQSEAKSFIYTWWLSYPLTGVIQPV